MRGAEQRGPRPGEGGQVLVGDGPGDDLSDGVGDPVTERRPGERGGQRLQGRGAVLVDPGQAVHQRVVEAVDQGEGLGETVGRGPQGVGEHQRTAAAAGNHCSSGSGSVDGSTSR